MTLLVTKIIWCMGVVGWFVIRRPHARRSRRTLRGRFIHRGLEQLLLAISTCGLGIIPALYVFTGTFKFADYEQRTWQPWIGSITFAFALLMFWRSHADLGRNWSVTLEVKEDQILVSKGVYKCVRHPMYAAFWLWATSQALLLPNWVGGFSGMVGFGCLYMVRVRREENMMIEIFGSEYRSYMQRTWRLIPYLF
jgi:protein-S-isoprenylcysteine O-methyltransferase Ste14